MYKSIAVCLAALLSLSSCISPPHSGEDPTAITQQHSVDDIVLSRIQFAIAVHQRGEHSRALAAVVSALEVMGDASDETKAKAYITLAGIMVADERLDIAEVALDAADQLKQVSPQGRATIERARQMIRQLRDAEHRRAYPLSLA